MGVDLCNDLGPNSYIIFVLLHAFHEPWFHHGIQYVV